MASVLLLFTDYKTYLAAIGLVGLAAYQASQGLYAQAFQSVLGALAAAGLRNEVPKAMVK